ncbi:tRNA (guanine-N1)-methyltransferase [Halobacteroides halobius DSM 5150]|uniref:tRNA (guanine-N(1)-)-methyltransferase n=1 Tax=Halobacteroides halobius (strain ATCC 35273 / DSM 5150 / MD-1) TaxID=748449 RepID=L0K5N8_HALHC|nr:tRNA (guanosine(37)-N1)-methyltransferase TrmD [Halobacteroides halobius]AGB40602.1 tRNA (guanine-N1)-methyltransferase [Halobacteroides halobius DSM 5150]
MKFDILTLFPDMFDGVLNSSILKRAQKEGLINFNITDIRNYCEDKHNQADDYPYGGGVGMVLKPEPIFKAVNDLQLADSQTPVVFLTPQGKTFDQSLAKDLVKKDRLVLLCGHYEGVDQRVRDELVTHEVSIGDYVLTGGELPAMVLVDAISRLVPGVVGSSKSVIQDSFYQGLLDYPQYTRPQEYNSLEVPQVLLSGNHAKIDRWRRKKALEKTLVKRPDLLKEEELSNKDKNLLEEIKKELGKECQDGPI